MARGRMVNKKISNSKRINDLPLQAQLLFTWLIPHLDCNGCFYGSAQMIKSLVFPRKNFTKKQIESWLKIMEASKNSENYPLIYRYSVNGEQYLFMPGFAGEQPGLRYDREKPEFPHFDGNLTASFPQNDAVREVEVEDKDNKEVEDKDNIFNIYIQEIGDLTPSISENLKELSEEYPFSEIREAVKIAVVNNKRSLGYIKGILKKQGKKDAPTELLEGMEV